MYKGRLNMKGMIALISVLFLFVLISDALSASAPEINYIGTIPDQAFAGRVISDMYGDIFIGDTENKVIRIFNHRGAYQGSINLPSKILSLAVSPENLIYAGLSNGEIYIYSRNGIFQGKLSGLVKPVSIAFSQDGNLYVIDESYFVKIFDSSGNFIKKFGGYGMDNGRFVSPVSISINNSEIYILDTMGAYATEGSYTNTPVWEVNVFDLDGNFIRSFSNYGFSQEGKLGIASSLSTDSSGRVYISDFIQGIIGVYDGYGAHLKTIYDLTHPIYSPVNIAINNNKLYIASTMAKSVSIYGIDNYPQLEITPQNMSFSYQSGVAVTPQVLNVKNNGNAPLTWHAYIKDSWLVMSETSGEVQPGGSVNVNLTVNPVNMAPGDYKQIVEILSNGGSESLTVTLTVYPSPVLNVNPLSFYLRTTRNARVDSLVTNISIMNDLSNSITWMAGSDVDWLTITPSSGSSVAIVPANISVSTNLPPGAYTGHITVSATGAAGSPAQITVNLEITSKGRIKVNTNIEGATYTITGPDIFEGKGSTIIEGEAGRYTIKFNPVEGYRTPPSQSGVLNPGEEIVFNGSYTEAGKVNILATHGPGKKDNTEIRVFDDKGQLLKTIPPLKGIRGGATVTLGDIDGDGVSEVITGTGMKRDQSINILSADGSLLNTFKAFHIKDGVGVEVESADLNGDGRSEIIAGTSRLRGILKIFEMVDGSPVERIEVNVYRGANGIRITTLDADGDGIPEIVTVPKRGGGATLNIMRIDTLNWKYDILNSFKVCEDSGSREVTSSDINNDNIPEIILSCQYDTGTVVKIYSIDGNLIREFPAGSTSGDYITSDDINGDGNTEIIIGDGPSAHKTDIRIFTHDGTLLGSYKAFEDSFGVRVKTGIIE